MNASNLKKTVFLCLVLGGVVGSWAWGQTGVGGLGHDPLVLPKPDRDIPAAALRTDEGIQLARQLQSLRRALSTLGPRHPSTEKVRSDIEAVKRRLASFDDDSATTGRDVETAMADPSSFSNAELRDLVVELSRKIKRLETRVSVLERRVQGQ